MISLIFIVLSGIGLYILVKPHVVQDVIQEPYPELPAFGMEKSVHVIPEPIFEKQTVSL